MSRITVTSEISGDEKLNEPKKSRGLELLHGKIVDVKEGGRDIKITLEIPRIYEGDYRKPITQTIYLTRKRFAGLIKMSPTELVGKDIHLRVEQVVVSQIASIDVA